jgi:hypothetical protein
MAPVDNVSKVRRMGGGVLAAIGVSLFGASVAAERPNLGEARDFAVLASSTVSSTGLSTVTGHVGVSPGTGMTGFPPATVTGGAIHVVDLKATAAHRDASLAYAFLKGMPSIPDNELTGLDLGGMTLAPGVYTFSSSAGLTGALTLDAGGNSDAVFVFQVASQLTTAPGSAVVVINGGADYDESNVYWQIGSSATLDTTTAFTGNILAYSSISLATGATMIGNALALNGAVTLDASTVTSAPRAAERAVRHPMNGHSRLAPPEGALDANARGRVSAHYTPESRTRVDRSRFEVSGRRLDALTGYTLWMDNPATAAPDLVQIDTVTTGRAGAFRYGKDTRSGDALPFGLSLSNLSGVAVEVRDSTGTTTVLAGVVPTTSP